MRECSLTQTTVDAGQRALPAGGAAGRGRGNSEPDCAGANVDAEAGAAGANPPCVGVVVVEANCARQDLRNCGHVAPLVVHDAFAACHRAPHCFMIL
jgi:hypothetical protein